MANRKTNVDRGGRPRNPQRPALLLALEKYIDETNIPILAEFAYQNKITRECLYTWEEFRDLIKLCHEKKEADLERAGLAGDAPPAIVVFSLKQLGWKDSPSIAINTIEPLIIQDEQGKKIMELSTKNGNGNGHKAPRISAQSIVQ